MMRMIWLIIGCVMGFVFRSTMVGAENVVNRNTVGFVVLVLLIIAFGMGRRNKAEATATAVATAISNARVEFDAELAATATALAQNAVTIHLSNAGVTDADPAMLVQSAAAAIEAEKKIETSLGESNTTQESVGYL